MLVDTGFSSILKEEWGERMIFLVIGIIFLLIGLIFFIFPSKKINFIYGYRSFLAKQNDIYWRYAQKISSRYFLLFGALMTLIGGVLRWQDWTNFFILEMIAIPWFIVPMFGLIEENLQRFDKEYRGEDNEYIND
ncbi:SdpI family protein [Enterococcus sp. RIT-PI-f]|uniref:SdpI family protein n=1 Tax=Enterococcus sp. RIT-PI-f TaxID=1690244 RepID=UPI001F29344F